jgi:hypothetical protein
MRALAAIREGAQARPDEQHVAEWAAAGGHEVIALVAVSAPSEMPPLGLPSLAPWFTDAARLGRSTGARVSRVRQVA